MKALLMTICSFLLIPAATYAAAENFIWPLDVWDTHSTQHGDVIGDGVYHMGVDAGVQLGEGAPVYAIADGVVVEAQERTKFGMVVLIEHTLASGKKIVSLYGHLKSTPLPIAVGDAVVAGQQIGFLGSQEENGGWVPHIHFGIHKQPYTGDWVYEGHVTQKKRKKKWYDPEVYIPKRLTADTWKPQIVLPSIVKNQFVGRTLGMDAYVSDVGSQIDTVSIQVKEKNSASWETLSTASDIEEYPYALVDSLSTIADGSFQLRIIATDHFGNTTKKKIRLRKKADAAEIFAFAGIFQSVGGALQTVMQDSAIQQYDTTFGKRFIGKADVTAGSFSGSSVHEIAAVNAKPGLAVAKVLNRSGVVQERFPVFGKKRANTGVRIASGDIADDDTDELVVVSGQGQKTVLRAFTAQGTQLWSRQAFQKAHRRGADVTVADTDGDGTNEILVGSADAKKHTVVLRDASGKYIRSFRTFGKLYRGDMSIDAGDIDGDGKDEIIVAASHANGITVRFYTGTGKRVGTVLQITEENFTGDVDITTTDWENDGKMEVVVSQIADNDNVVYIYRTGAKQRQLMKKNVSAIRVAAWK